MRVFLGKYGGVVTLNRDGRERIYFIKKRTEGKAREGADEAEVKAKRRAEDVGCDHTSTKAPDPIRTPKLSVLGRE